MMMDLGICLFYQKNTITRGLRGYPTRSYSYILSLRHLTTVDLGEWGVISLFTRHDMSICYSIFTHLTYTGVHYVDLC